MSGNNLIPIEHIIETRTTQPSQPKNTNIKNDDIFIDSSFSKFTVKKKTVPFLNINNVISPAKTNIKQNNIEELEKLSLFNPRRKDSYGIVIIKNQKGHKVKFREIDFTEIVEIENWKIHNIIIEENTKNTCLCNCHII